MRPLDMSLVAVADADYVDLTSEARGSARVQIPGRARQPYIAKLESDMREAAKRFEFEKAARLRDQVRELRSKEFMVHLSQVVRLFELKRPMRSTPSGL